MSPAWSVTRDTPLYPTNEIMPAPYDLESTLRVIAPQPVPVAVPAIPPPMSPAAAPKDTAAPAQAETAELPLRRAGEPIGAETAGPQAMVPAQAGPSAVSPFQTPGGPYTTFRAGFDVNPPATDRVGPRLSRQLTASPRIDKRSRIQVEVQGQTAVLRGTVASDYDRRIAEQAVRMEAGIWSVRNELTVAAGGR